MRAMIFGAVAALAVTAMPAAAQATWQNIVVTASRIDIEDTVSAPAIYRRIPADFVLMTVNFQSGTRNNAERRAELSKSFDALKDAAANTDGFKLQGGELGESSAPIDTVKFSDVYSTYNTQGSFKLTLGVDTREGESFDKLMERAQSFTDSVKLTGRAEAFLGDEQFLGARNTDKHRADLMTDIQNDVADLRARFTPAMVTVTGLESRVITQPSGPLELEMFIPYTLRVESGGN